MKRLLALALLGSLGACGPAGIGSGGDRGDASAGSDGSDSGPGDGDGDPIPGDGDGEPTDSSDATDTTGSTDSSDATDTGEAEPSFPELPPIECETLAILDETVILDERSTLADFAALVCVEEVTGRLEILDTQVEHLGFLANLRRVGERLYISGNHSLKSLADLHALVEVGGNLTIKDNDALVDLEGLGSIATLGGVYILDNAALQSVAGFEGALHFTAGTLYTWFSIGGNPSLTSLDGLAGISSATADPPLTIQINNNAQLGGDLVGLSGWISDEIVQQLTITNNSLASLEGLEGLTTLDRLHLLGPGGDFPSLLGLDNLESVGSLMIGACLCGWDTIGAGHDYRLPKIESLAGLEALVSVGHLWIWGNEALTNIDALANVETATWVTIAQNPLLPEAAVADLLAGIEVASTITVFSNGTGQPPYCSCPWP